MPFHRVKFHLHKQEPGLYNSLDPATNNSMENKPLNRSMIAAKASKQDEFYTQLSDIEKGAEATNRLGDQRILIVNGHGGNTPAQGFIGEWMADHPRVRIKFHNWWNAPKVWAQVQAIDPVASHASWMENFPWTRLANVNVPPHQKPMSDPEKVRRLDPKSAREYLNDGNYGGLYQRSDEEMMQIWRTAVEETRELLSKNWK
jgi:creatinine amidohydrolase